MTTPLLEYDRTIRPSSTTGWNDCPRRQVASAYRPLVMMMGYRLRKLPSHIGAAVGTGVHAGNESALKEKMATGSLGPWDVAENAAVEAAAERIREGVMWDATTENRSTAENQVRRMTKQYYQQVAPQVWPLVIEERLEADAGDGWKLSGQPDTLTQAPGELRDTKTGTTKRGNLVQYGAYALLLGAHGYDVQKVTEDFIQRVRMNKPQPAVHSDSPPLDVAKAEAWATLADMRQAIEKFVAWSTADGPTPPPETALRVNPMSPLCSDRFCPAWGTDFCRAHQGAK